MGASRIVFEDGGGRLGPLTDLRCACEVRSGALLGWQRLGAEALFVPAVREQSVAARTGLRVNALPKGSRFLLLNGRLMAEPKDARRLAAGEALVDADGSVLAACLDEADASGVILGRWPANLRRATLEQAEVLRRPWDLLSNEALERRTARVYPGATLLPELIVGATDSRFFRHRGTVAYGTGLFAPGVSFEQFASRFHGHDERIDTASLGLCVDLWEGIAEDLLT